MTTSFLRLLSLIASLAILPGFTAKAQPSNDECANAITVTLTAGVLDTTLVNTVGATQSMNEPDTAVWYKVTVPTDGQLFILTTTADGDCSDEDTHLSVFKGSDCNNLTTLIDGQDRDNTDCRNNEFTRQGFYAGDIAYIATGPLDYGDPDDPVFNLVLQFDTAPANDSCMGATFLSLDGNNYASATVNTTGATMAGDPDSTGNNVWYKFIAPVDGDYIITTDNTDGNCDENTFFGVTSSCGDNPVVYNNDNGDCGEHEADTISANVNDTIFIFLGHYRRDQIIPSNSDSLSFELEIMGPLLSPSEPLPLQSRSHTLLVFLLVIGITGFSLVRMHTNS